jgi:hypothetical protein
MARRDPGIRGDADNPYARLPPAADAFFCPSVRARPGRLSGLSAP